MTGAYSRSFALRAYAMALRIASCKRWASQGQCPTRWISPHMMRAGWMTYVRNDAGMTIEMEIPLYITKAIIRWDKIKEDSYIRGIPAVAQISDMEFHKPITLLAGENGIGKSTLLEALAVASGFNPEGGTRNYVFSTYDSHSELCDCINLVRGIRQPKWGYFLRAESFYNVATQEDEYSRGPGGMPEHFHEKSHGESFYRVAESQFRGNGLYFLDEPEAALSPQRQLALLRIICLCARRGAQFFIVTHSPILLGMPYAEIIGFSDNGIATLSYEETESYQITSLFLNQRERILAQLLKDE